MEYDKMMEYLYIECGVKKENIIVDALFETIPSKTRIVMFEFALTGKNIKAFTENGKSLKIEISKPRSEMNLIEYLKLLCKSKIKFDIDFDSNEIDGRTIVIAHTCDCGCVELPAIVEFRYDNLSQLIHKALAK